MPPYPLSTNISIGESSSIVHCHGKRMWTVWFQKSRKRLALWDVLEIHSHKQQDGSTNCLSSSQTCSTVRMRTGLHSQTHARTDSSHIHGHTCLRHTRTHTRSNATVVTGFCSSFPLAEFPFPLFSVPLVNISIVIFWWFLKKKKNSIK